MMSKSEEEEEDYVLYADRPEWKDVDPVPQVDPKPCALPIAYSKEFSDVMDYFRAVLVSGEMSERVFRLNEDALYQNPANYTAWVHRRRVLKALGKDLRKELEYVAEMIQENPKNYQVWFHRQAIIEQIGMAEGELAFVENMLLLDEKNYHAWSYRQWVVENFAGREGELDFTERMLSRDARNNSAWSYRFWILWSHVGEKEEMDVREKLENEISFTFGHLYKIQVNDSAWNYLHGIVRESASVDVMVRVAGQCDEFLEKHVDCVGALATKSAILADLYPMVEGERSVAFMAQCRETCEKLKMIDLHRHGYWEYRIQALMAAKNE